ncbi:hypothetical protein EVAR_82010_1 [Eumeta japonica]|uniref:Uncharacterized protein n=1 Tax=Eumeta variegata TaxID=151549 RepID=A0A4C1VVI0_EUMVA|nr:hypothetical protein EVAR_82010_1 [Eumeta japonica]
MVAKIRKTTFGVLVIILCRENSGKVTKPYKIWLDRNTRFRWMLSDHCVSTLKALRQLCDIGNTNSTEDIRFTWQNRDCLGGVNKNMLRGILRAVSQQPDCLKCFAGVRLGMPLLLAVLSSSATYIILVLQFTHFI